MPFDGQARWQIDILAADKTAQAFATVDRRLKAMEVTQRAASASLNAGFALVTRALAPVAAALSAAAVAQRVWQAGMEAANLGEQAEQIGLTTDALQAYRLAAAQNGVEAAQLDSAMMRLTKSMGEAARGSDEAIARFEKLGVRLLDNQGNLRRTSDILPELATGLLEIGNQAQRDALMMELFGRSGGRMVTMLEAFSGGQAKLTAEAREMAAIMGVDVIAAWDKLDDRLKVVNQQMTVFQATVGAPLALGGLAALEWTLRQIADGYRIAKNAAIDFGLKIGTSVRGANIKALESDVAALEKTIATRAGTLQGMIDAMTSGAGGEMDDLSRARLQGLRRDLAGVEPLKQQLAEKKAILDKARAEEADYRRGAEDNRVNRQLGLPMEPQPVTFRDFGLKGQQPIGKNAAAAGAKLDERLKDLQVERAALEKALAAFDVGGLDSVAEVDRRLDAQVKLDQKIASLLKDVPPNSPLAQQLIQEATSVSQLNTRLDERKRILTEAEQVTAQFGDGSRAAARATADLNAMLAAGAIDADTYARALKATKDAAADQARAARGAAGGFDGFMAGVEQYGAEMQKANSAFEMGRYTAQEFGSVFSGVNQGLREGKDLWTALGDSATTALGRIADKLIEMATQNLFEAAFGGSGGGGGGGGILNLFGGGSSGTSSGLFDGVMGLFDFFPTFAEGGNYRAGVPRIVGEKGWELDVPGTSGTIYNQRQLASLLGAVGGADKGVEALSYGGPRAAGGPVDPSRWYMVGEQGPETFVPQTAGTILPFGAQQGGGETTVIVQQTVHVGEYVTSTEFRRGLGAVKDAAQQGALAAIIDDRRRGGKSKRAFA